MSIYSNCSGPCEMCTTFYIGGCLAGHGDDMFNPVTPEFAASLLDRPVEDNIFAKVLTPWEKDKLAKIAGRTLTPEQRDYSEAEKALLKKQEEHQREMMDLGEKRS